MAAELVEAMNMVKSFRVSDLQTLLASMGRSKSGLKQDLVGRALRLVQTEYSPELLKNVRQLYETRYPKASAWLAARRPDSVPVNYPALNSSPRNAAQGADYLNGIPKPAPPPVTEVKLVPLPFYHNLETLLPPTELIAQNSEKLQESQCVFELTPCQVEQIRNASELRPGMKSVQVVLRICYTDSIGVQEDQYPPNIAVKVNQSYCHVPGYYPSNKPGVEPRRPCRPVNITPWLHLSSVTNRVTITWGNFGKRYSVAVYLVRVFTSGELFNQLKHCSVESPERCRERIQDKLRFDPESEIATTGLRVSLICPLVKMRLGVPCRVLTCAHLQCFDAVFFLQMNEKKPTWTCPVCDKPAPFELLTIDGLLSEILKETPEDVEEIEYLTDGSWRPIRDDKEKERERENSCTPDYPVVDICVPEANGHSPAHSGTNQTGKSGSSGTSAGTGGTSSGSGGAAVVDLTLDDSSEEEGGGGAEESEDTDDSQDSPAPKRGRYDYDKDLVTAY
ncbi:E3 SUMO-protein ligase PIAS4-A [Triplophysa rosa]|uniref:RING-type E3 ubiquitin transferase n=1 Tax=Triplophysa rosa TaxID=992332 RepID=A0A9W7T5X1_TRIRA|nr:E3 SUMO-protein ligase PIAS4-A [Triplophysa rosa]KAI7791322.1 protein inhibitor of activated STAT-4 [Triplophysa rosa]